MASGKKLTKDQVIRILALHKAGNTNINIEKLMGINKGTVSAVLTGKAHADITGIVKDPYELKYNTDIYYKRNNGEFKKIKYKCNSGKSRDFTRSTS